MQIIKSILLVEDDVDDQEFFVECLGQIENAVLFGIAETGIEALKKIKNSVTLPDLIFMDINMPEMNGIACLKKLMESPGTRDIPVVMLSTSSSGKEITRELGAKAFLS